MFAVIFDFYDLNGDGFLTESELLQISGTLYNLGYGDQQLDGPSVSRLFLALPTILTFSTEVRQACVSKVRPQQG